MSQLPEIKSRKQAKLDGDKYYFSGKVCPNGHVDLRLTSSYCCLSCQRQWVANERATNPEFKARQQKICRENNLKRYYSDPEYKAHVNREAYGNWKIRFQDPDKRKEMYEWARAWRKRNPDKAKATSEKYRNANPDKMAFAYSLRSCMKRLKKLKTDSFVMPCLGYSKAEFKDQIESLFTDGMSWENYGDWHVDHIRPVHIFVKEGILDLSVIHKLSNLQPLWAFDNQSKGGKY